MAESKKNNTDVKDYLRNSLLAGTGAATGSAINSILNHKETLDVYQKHDKGRRKIKGSNALQPHDYDRKQFIKKLKKGDILISGAYNPETPYAKVLRDVVGGNKGAYHAAVYTGRGRTVEKIPDKTIYHGSILKSLGDGDRIMALRPEFKSNAERDAYVKRVTENLKKTKYSLSGAVGAYAARLTGIPRLSKKIKCKGRFCSNEPAIGLPKRMQDQLKTHPSFTTPQDLVKNPQFKHVGEINMYETERFFKNPKRLKRIAGKAGLAAVGAAGITAGVSQIKDKDLNIATKAGVVGATAGGVASWSLTKVPDYARADTGEHRMSNRAAVERASNEMKLKKGSKLRKVLLRAGTTNKAKLIGGAAAVAGGIAGTLGFLGSKIEDSLS